MSYFQTTDWFMRKPVTMLEFMFNTKLLLQSCNKIAEIVQNFKWFSKANYIFSGSQARIIVPNHANAFELSNSHNKQNQPSFQ